MFLVVFFRTKQSSCQPFLGDFGPTANIRALQLFSGPSFGLATARKLADESSIPMELGELCPGKSILYVERLLLCLSNEILIVFIFLGNFVFNNNEVQFSSTEFWLELSRQDEIHPAANSSLFWAIKWSNVEGVNRRRNKFLVNHVGTSRDFLCCDPGNTRT